VFSLASGSAVVALLAATVMAAGPPQPRYQVNKLTGPAPTIDGVVDPGEWDRAAPQFGNFVGLRDGTLDTKENRFRMLWDNEALYVLGQNSFADFADPTDFLGAPPFDGSHDNVNIYFDPNTNGKDFSARTDTVDGYQIAWHEDTGFAQRKRPLNPADPARSGDYITGFFLEAHTNTLFGNNAGWNDPDTGDPLDGSILQDFQHLGIELAQNASNVGLNPGVTWELKIPWTEFNADQPDVNGTNLGSGLYHPTAPDHLDSWAFEFGEITRDPSNFLPSWSEPVGGNPRNFFAAWPHGKIQFALANGDADGDGDVDNSDIGAHFGNFTGPLSVRLGGKTAAEGDNDGDDDVDNSDIGVVFGNFTGPGVAASDGEAATSGENATLQYNPETGEVILNQADAPAGIITNFVLQADGGEFLTGVVNFPFQGVFKTDLDTEISQSDPLALGLPTTDFNLGAILPAGLTRAEVVEILTRASYVGGLGTGVRPLEIFIPEPSSLLLAAFGLMGLGFSMRRRRNAA